MTTYKHCTVTHISSWMSGFSGENSFPSFLDGESVWRGHQRASREVKLLPEVSSSSFIFFVLTNPNLIYMSKHIKIIAMMQSCSYRLHKKRYLKCFVREQRISSHSESVDSISFLWFGKTVRTHIWSFEDSEIMWVSGIFIQWKWVPLISGIPMLLALEK